MPKSKSRKLEESSGSDSDSSGPRDRNPPPKKQAKTESSPAKSSGSKPKGGGEDHSWTLDKKRVVKINEFRGTVFVDIREYYEKDGEMKPGKKGISLSATQWQKLKEAMPEIDDALKTY